MYYCTNTITQKGDIIEQLEIRSGETVVPADMRQAVRRDRARRFPAGKQSSLRERTRGVNPNTVQRALSELEDEGILVSRRGDGRYVADNGTLRDNMLLERSRTATLEFVRAMRDLGLDDPMIRESLEKALSAPSDTKGVDAASGTTVYS